LGLGLVDGVSDIKRACYRNIRLPAFRLDCDLRGIWIIAALFFERLLKRSNIHGNVVRSFLAIFADAVGGGQAPLKATSSAC